MNLQVLRTFIDRVVVYVGTAVVLLACIFAGVSSFAMVLIIMGLVIVQLGVWHVASNSIPSGRKYPELRSTVDIFLDIVRELRRITEIDPLSGGIGDMRNGMIDALKVDLRTQTEVVIEATEKKRI